MAWLLPSALMSPLQSLTLSVLLLSPSLAAPTLSDVPSATNVYGKDVTYRGLYANEVEGFIGIRYALDTGGENRFRPPQPYVPDSGSTIDVTTPGPSCPQRVSHGAPSVWNVYDYVNHISEDCLKLNVWRPNGTNAGDKLPVLVYIHGGSFLSGNKDGQLAQPGGMILQAIDNEHPIMNVELNYRLGIFGFQQSDALIQEHSVNAGVKDQRLALEWVYDNIAAFGGDPSRITIHGQSSGGLAVGMQILAYGGAKPYPFQQAICQSQALEPGITGNYTLHQTYRVWLQTNCTDLAFDSAENADCLRRVPMETLLQAQLDTHSASPNQNDGDNYLPIVDGDFLPAAPSTLLAEGRFAKRMRTIIGWTNNDAVLFTPTDNTTPHQTYRFLKLYLPAFSERQLQKLLALYPRSDFRNTYFKSGKVKLHAEVYRLGRIFRDLLFTCQPIFIGQNIAAAGNAVYFYNQNQTMLGPALKVDGLAGMGPVHESEMIYVFGNLSKYDNIPGYPYHPRPSDYWLRVHQSRSWSSFVATGHPSLAGHATLPGWRVAQFDDGNYGTYVIGGPTHGFSGESGEPRVVEAMAQEKLGERCGFLNSPEIVEAMQY